MGLSIGNITINTADPRRLADWWVAAMNGRIDHDYGDYIFTTVAGMGLGFQRADAKGPNKIHIDLVADDPAAEVARLTGLGAVHVSDHEVADMAWTVLADPDGNQFCVARAH